MIFLDDGHGEWLVATDRRKLLEVLLLRLPEVPTMDQLEGIAAACLGCAATDLVIRET